MSLQYIQFSTVHLFECTVLHCNGRRERSKIPAIVSACVREIEARGMREVGIYRVCGAANELQELKRSFDRNATATVALLANRDIHLITGAPPYMYTVRIQYLNIYLYITLLSLHVI